MPQIGTASLAFHALRASRGQLTVDSRTAELDAWATKLTSGKPNSG